MANPEDLLSGAWVSRCFSQPGIAHIPFVSHLQFFRMFYYFDHDNQTVGHVVREYQDALCEENFNGEINPNVNDTMVVKGKYQITRADANFPNVIRVAFNWISCSGTDCQRSQNPVDQTYLFQNRLAVFRQSNDGRQVLFWGANVPPRLGSSTPYLPDQQFSWAVPFFRINLDN
jgi:hypothetical protein